MSIIYNGTTIENITYNGTTLDTVNYNNTEVFTSGNRLTVNIGKDIRSIEINNVKYTSSVSVDIEPNSNVLLRADVINYYKVDDDGEIDLYNKAVWSGYENRTDIVFRFTMPSRSITYNVNGEFDYYKHRFGNGTWDISESLLFHVLNNKYDIRNRYDTSKVNYNVILNEGNSTHTWKIIRVNSDSYDLWYNGSIGDGRWTSTGTGQYWLNQSFSGNNPRNLCYQYKSRLSSDIQSRLKTGLNANCGSDLVVMLSAKQLGGTEYSRYLNDDNSAISYFNKNTKRQISSITGNHGYLTTTAASNKTSDGYFHWVVYSTGELEVYMTNLGSAVVPAIRVG